MPTVGIKRAETFPVNKHCQLCRRELRVSVTLDCRFKEGKADELFRKIKSVKS